MDAYLVRHAKSDYDWERWPTDEVRPLSSKGRKRQIQISQGMKAKGFIFSEAWVSPYKRAQETLGIIKDQYGIDIPTKVVDELAVGGSSRQVVELILQASNQQPNSNLILVGHNPNMSLTASLITGERIEMSTSDIVWVKIDNGKTVDYRYYARDIFL